MNQMTGKSRRILENVIKCRSPSRTLLVVKDVERPSPGANRIFTDLVKEARLNSPKHWPGFPQADMVANPISADERKSGVTQDENLKDKSGDLRTRAEELLRQKVGDVGDISGLSPADVQKLVHELEVHQIELEMQNEELRRAQIELEQSRDRYSDLYDFAPVGYFTLDRYGLILEVNLTGAVILAADRSFLIGKPFQRFLVKEYAEPFFLHSQEVFETKTRQRCEAKLQKSDGRLFDAQLESVAREDSDGLPSRCRMTVSDITDRKRAEEALTKAHADLEQKVVNRTADLGLANKSLVLEIEERKRGQESLARSNKDLEYFAYVASHDLQEPLRNVSSCLGLLERAYKEKLGSDADRLIEYAVQSVLRMKALVMDLLKFSRIATQREAFGQTDCREALSKSLMNLDSAINRSGAVITHDELPEIQADSTQLMRVFQNLIGNAIRFRGDEQSRIHVSARRNDREWEFSVRDNGIGIDSEYFDKIFVVFQQLDKKEKHIGTGIGLSIVKKIVERHGGRVWVESKVGVGSTFHFTIPFPEVVGP